MKTLQGKLTISRTSGGDESRPITIRLTDELSGCEVTEIRMGLAEFAMAVTNLGGMPCEFDWRPAAPIGKRREHKTEVVWIPSAWTNGARNMAVVRKALEPHEIDGWKARENDATEQQRRSVEPYDESSDIIIDRGRGPELVGTRITIYIVMDYVNENCSPSDIARYLQLTDDQVLTAIKYIEDHREQIEEEYERIKIRVSQYADKTIAVQVPTAKELRQRIMARLAGNGDHDRPIGQ